ncbi:hypothetical protein PG996_006420 [Apiospora saccharicola]|uniref:CHAT domain-containing protein n=1 Tax=Apiospora saccharicola TaxID=335842 RepID=A0ABR1VQD7_9PEZI
MEPPPYRGIHTSLYHTLPADAIQHLERAIWLKIIGRTTEAREIYQNELRPFENTPVVIVELADLVHEAGRWGESWRILNKGLDHAEESDQDLDRPEYRLMALTLAMLGTRHRGDIESSAREVARTQRWLQSVPIADYTDIQASCIRRYVICYLFTKLYSAYENDEAELIPTAGSGDAWSGLHELRRSLCTRGMVKEANAIFRVELNRTPIESREPVVEEFLSELAEIPESRDRSYFEAIVRLQWANTLVMLQRVPRASEEMDLSEAAFNRFCDMQNISNRADAPHMQSLEYERLACIQDPIEKLARTESLAARFELVESFKTGSCLSDAADLAHLFFKFLSDPDYQTKYFDLQTRLERYDETVSEDMTDLVQHYNSLISFTLSTSVVDRQKSLEWIDGFLERHAYFRAPATMASLYRSQALLFRSLRRMEEAGEADKKVAELDAYVPLIGDWINHRSVPVVVPAREPRDVEEPADDDEVVDEQFFWPWRNAMQGDNGADTTTMDLVWQWSLEDVAAGRLGVQDFRDMMGITDPDIKLDIRPRGIGDIAKVVGSDRMNDLASAIYPASPEVVASQEAQYERICQWLSEYPPGIRIARETPLLPGDAARQPAGELEKLLELEMTLPRTIRETFPTFRLAWVGAMSMTLVAELGPVADLTGDEPSRILREAERWNEDALEEHRRVNDRVSYAMFLRSGAQICLLNIFRLQQLMDTADPSTTGVVFLRPPATPPIQELQAKGLGHVEEADAILSVHEMHASWDDGLDSVAHRQGLTRFYGSAYTAIAAITLHLAVAPDDEDEDEAAPEDVAGSSIWRWVQKYKARSLARTIGVRSYEPPGLIGSILESPETQTLYQEMLDLKRRTDEAELMDRFELRRQMDAHLQRMKDAHPLLRQLVDLREATPFAVADIAALEAQAGCTVVLVDWFYLPHYLANQTGRMLLFTARDGQTPTMDILPVTEADVLAWQEQYLSPPTWKHYREENLNTPEARGRFNAMLGGLVAPLAQRTKRGEVLVLCPSSVLHRVPLHALNLTTTTTTTAVQDGGEGGAASTKTKTKTEALIHRNPIIYTHSHSLLRSCAAAADAVTSRLIHLHTHCNWRAGDPLNHHVEFPRVPNSTSTTTTSDDDDKAPRPKLTADNDETTKPDDRADDRPVDRLAARELFDIKLPASTHVNLIACQGGVADVQLGDEVMGLVPALLYAGASSTVSTLWSIDDGDGARFARHFFDSFLRQCRRKKKAKSGSSGGDGVGFVDIAKAVREAAGEMDASHAEPLYTWAAFVMHGFWRFPVSATDLEALKSQQ